MHPMKGANAKLSEKVRAELITHTYIVTTPVKEAAADGASREDIVLRNSMHVVVFFSSRPDRNAPRAFYGRCTYKCFWQARRACKHILCVMGLLGVNDLNYLLRNVGGLRRRHRPNSVLRDSSTFCGGIQRAGKTPQHWLNQM